jgi:hypothetical protein
MVLDRQQPATQTTSSGLGTALTGVSALTALLVLVQAVLAGRGWFVDPDFIDIHEIVANVVFLVALVQAVLAFVAMRRGLATRAVFGVAVAVVVLVVAQIGLGYGGRESDEAASLHIPNGVLIFGLSIVAFMQARGR